MSLVWAAAGGALYCLGYAGFGLWPLALIAWAALWWALERVHSFAAACMCGFVFGEVAHAGGFAWLLRLVDAFLGGDWKLGAALFALHSVAFAAAFTAHAALYYAARRRGVPLAVAGPAALVIVEWSVPQLFPAHLADAFVDRTGFVQGASLGGPLLVSALAGLVNATLLELARWRARVAPFPHATALACACAVAAAGAHGAFRVAALERADRDAASLRVGVVQENASPLAKRRNPEALQRAHIDSTRELLAQGALDLVVWPETVVSRGVAGPLPVAGDLIRGDSRVPLLFGAVSVRNEGNQRRVYNSALLIERDGTIRSGYDKNLLVPFAERLPFADVLARAFPHAQHFGAAHETPALVLDGVRIATPICYEAAVASYVRRMVREARPNLLVMLANDGWFGDSHEPRIHLAVARLRAIEHGRWVVRATNGGISALIDPAGRVVARTPLLERALMRGTVRVLSSETLYTRVGDWPGPVAAALLVALALRPRKC